MAKQQQYGSRFLYAEDLLIDGEFKTFTGEIDRYIPPGELKASDGTVIDKPSIGFKGKEKLLVLCSKTNQRVLHYLTGNGWEHGDRWVGHSVTIQARYVEAFGDIVPAIRVIPPVGTKLPRAVLKRLGEKAVFKA